LGRIAGRAFPSRRTDTGMGVVAGAVDAVAGAQGGGAGRTDPLGGTIAHVGIHTGTMGAGAHSLITRISRPTRRANTFVRGVAGTKVALSAEGDITQRTKPIGVAITDIGISTRSMVTIRAFGHITRGTIPPRLAHAHVGVVTCSVVTRPA